MTFKDSFQLKGFSGCIKLHSRNYFCMEPCVCLKLPERYFLFHCWKRNVYFWTYSCSQTKHEQFLCLISIWYSIWSIGLASLGSCQATTGHSAYTSCSSNVFLQAFRMLLGAASFSPPLLPTMQTSQHSKARICTGKKKLIIKNEGRFFCSVLFFNHQCNKPVKKHCQSYCIIPFWASRRLDLVQGRESKN